jgi:hypothetical protein
MVGLRRAPGFEGDGGSLQWIARRGLLSRAQRQDAGARCLTYVSRPQACPTQTLCFCHGPPVVPHLRAGGGVGVLMPRELNIV